ncbi:MAG: antitoxin family protein [Vicinamibacterales bacterium]
MKETLDAVYENGVFRPLKAPTGLGPHSRVTITVTAEDQASSLIGCANRISGEDAREMREIIDREFEHVDPRDWK